MKKKIIAISCVLLVALIGINVLSNADFIKKDNSYIENEDDGDNSSKPTRPRDLYPADWETDIMTIPAYLAKNRYFKYGNFNGSYVDFDQTISTREMCQKTGGSPLVLMYDYFEYLRQGNHEAINALYRDDYFDGEEKKPYEAFPQQKVYDVFVRKYNYQDKNFTDLENVEPTYYLVTYKIMENDGLFRYELDADTEIPQLFGVLTYADGTSEIYMMFDLPEFSLS